MQEGKVNQRAPDAIVISDNYASLRRGAGSFRASNAALRVGG